MQNAVYVKRTSNFSLTFRETFYDVVYKKRLWRNQICGDNLLTLYIEPCIAQVEYKLGRPQVRQSIPLLAARFRLHSARIRKPELWIRIREASFLRFRSYLVIFVAMKNMLSNRP
jgi:hypothetical protein